jgi:hypothetical protein
MVALRWSAKRGHNGRTSYEISSRDGLPIGIHEVDKRSFKKMPAKCSLAKRARPGRKVRAELSEGGAVRFVRNVEHFLKEPVF